VANTISTLSRSPNVESLSLGFVLGPTGLEIEVTSIVDNREATQPKLALVSSSRRACCRVQLDASLLLARGGREQVLFACPISSSPASATLRLRLNRSSACGNLRLQLIGPGSPLSERQVRCAAA